MAFTLGNVGQSTYGTTNPNVLSFTCNTGAKLLVCFLFNNDAERTGGDPTYNSLPMTDSGAGYVIHTECGISIWYLIDPPTGSAYDISFPNSGGSNIQISAACFIPAAGKTAAKDKHASATGLTDDPSLTLTSVGANALVLGGLASGDRDVPSAGTNFTLIHTYDAGNQVWGSERWLDAGAAGNKTVGILTVRADDWGLIGLSFIEATSATPITVADGFQTQTGDASVVSLFTCSRSRKEIKPRPEMPYPVLMKSVNHISEFALMILKP